MGEAKTTGGPSYFLMNRGKVDGVVVHCSDPRFQSAFRQFIDQVLGMRNPAPIVVPGGIHDLVSPTRGPVGKEFQQQLQFMIQLTGAKRVALFANHDCAWYARWNETKSDIGDDKLAADLATAAALLSEMASSPVVECYIAKMEADEVVFDRVE